MEKVAFLPFSIATGLVAGVISRKAFAALWSVIDDQEPPKAEHHDVAPAKLALAVALEGAVFALTRAMVDHGSRQVFFRMTGSWPGEEEPASR
jgi:hypothetical protein